MSRKSLQTPPVNTPSGRQSPESGAARRQSPEGSLPMPLQPEKVEPAVAQRTDRWELLPGCFHSWFVASLRMLNLVLWSVFRIWIRIHVFLGLPGPDPSIIKYQVVRKTLISTVLWLFGLFIFEKLCKCTVLYLQKAISGKTVLKK